MAKGRARAPTPRKAAAESAAPDSGGGAPCLAPQQQAAAKAFSGFLSAALPGPPPPLPFRPRCARRTARLLPPSPHTTATAWGPRGGLYHYLQLLAASPRRGPASRCEPTFFRAGAAPANLVGGTRFFHRAGAHAGESCGQIVLRGTLRTFLFTLQTKKLSAISAAALAERRWGRTLCLVFRAAAPFEKCRHQLFPFLFFAAPAYARSISAAAAWC